MKILGIKKSSIPIEKLVEASFAKLIITGTGGIGKSMMMRHLFLHFAENYKTAKLLPVLTNLKSYDKDTTNIETFILNAIKAFEPEINDEILNRQLKMGKCLILMDGWDELPESAKDKFEQDLELFIKSYQESHIVITSRPIHSFVSFAPFQMCEILPFIKSEALELIDKLKFHDVEAKAKFRADLDAKLFESHKEFASNPLLLTIMLMTYSYYGDVPGKQHIFYAKAYETMTRLHDATKGSYVRPMHTKLSPEEFSEYFSEFCARTYYKCVLEFTYPTFKFYMDKIINKQEIPIKANSLDFLMDLTDNICLMFREGDNYYFIHRSFQEYFTAIYFANLMDDQLPHLEGLFETNGRAQDSIFVLNMLYDMIPKRIERFILLPYLKKLLKKCDTENGYWTFLELIYPSFSLFENSASKSVSPACSTICDFVLHYIIFKPLAEQNLQNPSRNPDKELLLKLGMNYSDILDVPQNDIGFFGYPINIVYILQNKSKYQELLNFLDNDEFTFKKEYNKLIEYTKHLENKYKRLSFSDKYFNKIFDS